ncbi:DUF262 domain-containing protein [Flavobacterium sp. HJJ]|uniref:DUF262 domain-containing protein n=1 Tax=Flavobacterium sp. HJJ TaxID=2783792 RepID=UPI001889E878|nr:DUF262 domain-containing protein [Flavobacterium sp. HJJ]MBF4473304.1 DUF262 domain-containing protein [Flavobacterium sp. HJJ]
MSSTTPLIDLFGKKFIIPHYQRGYRWEEQEVTELLDDIWNFMNTSNNGEFYCLQPIVVQKIKENEFNVLDGQQRLTTLYLILVYLESVRFENGYNQELFTLNYDTRDKCEVFLRDRTFITTIDESNIDFQHICNSYKYIDTWFKSHPGAKIKLVPILLDDNGPGNKNIRFIWYDVQQEKNPIDVFIRLNVGKIALTDAELIKALLLQSDKYHPDDLKINKMKLFEIATEWDTIEYTLQEEAFWYFLSNDENTKPTHIEFIFDAIANKIFREKKYFETKPLKHATFLILSAYLQDVITNENKSRIEAVKHIWEMVIEYFEYYKEWFENRQLYHYIGYLIESKGSNIIDTLIKESKVRTKKSFVSYLEGEIKGVIKINSKHKDASGNSIDVNLKDLCYENENQKSNDKPLIIKILFLHNVIATLKSEKEKAKFPFNLYKKTKKNEKWSLEHIHAQNAENITKPEQQKSWLQDHIKSLTNTNDAQFDSIIKKMNAALIDDNLDKEEFNKIVTYVYSLINKIAGITEKNTHQIDNLCLIDKNTNSQLNNSVFDVKREKIKKREVKGFYVPISSRNVFLKAYTDYPQNNAYWRQEDRTGYLKSLEETYDYFVNAAKK